MNTFLLLIVLSIEVWRPAYGDNIENKLYDSCIRHAEKKRRQDEGGKSMCRCLAQKYASGKAKNPDNPSETIQFEIKKDFIKDLMSDWKNVESPPEREVGRHLNKKRNKYETLTAEALGMGLGFNCLVELRPESLKK